MVFMPDFERLYRDWRRYYEEGVLSETLRPDISASWKRCGALGLDPLALNRTPVVSEEDFQERVRKNRNLLDESIPFMMELQEFVAGSGFSTTLTDVDGVVLELICDPEILEEAFTRNLVQGSIWNEKRAGTNATGLAITTAQPIQVIGEEHYFKCYHGLTCSASPIFDAQGQLLGVLDMSGPKEFSFPHTLGMVVAATKAITRQLCIAESNRQLDLTNHYLKAVMESMDKGVVAVDVNGKIIGINSDGAKILNTTTFDSYGKNILDIMEGENILVDGTGKFQSITREKKLVTGTGSINCLVNQRLIRHDNGDVAGVVATLKDLKHKAPVKRDVRKGTRFTFDDILGESSSLLRSVHLAKVASSGDSTILLLGDSGTGKEMFAQAVHNAHQSDQPFVAVNCAAIPENLMESILFGYEEGSFTGASRHGRKGKFELAEGGTIFLDEIGEMPMNTQTVLLRVLQERYVQRIGGTKDIPVNLRVIAATNQNLLEAVKEKRFRQDLYYRLNVLEIKIPALKDRPGDIPILAEAFMKELSEKFGKTIAPLLPSTIRVLEGYDWPGNVRQFRHAIEQAIYFTEKNRIDDYFISDYLPQQTRVGAVMMPVSEGPTVAGAVPPDLKALEMQAIREAIRRLGDKKKAAAFLGISRSTLYRKISQYHLDED
ncbi:Transcriptional regulator containing PAS, AAA-type ATPase, and DNA-binding Fis domains [Eubacterium aggregans]|uniref:Transcriptional regulator containing PAS, AAA-type ATPase, and DNA-binding Fis domains n=1 Tax=Eubacterium aggregans TaxID=81409 RepID=A0A1H4E679_9FIRM|nr:sigma 54-interacting transcriptional regulator [Eubacterium aggregans]SEA80060.1 Transcriptional regulator containing PAS, AAA-type ATPase, and DNA-binding Fis domains [Eubacterium aggregans]